ncbi:hypothetical protein FPV67DRAFT_1452501 [Lyophyllum atratum]|nr:hypothetical protein FPV67DRAFT_1452501 [Lyophyllum atratum]
MTQPCKECGGQTVWDDDAGSVICTQCGTLSDPSQSLLTDTAGLWDGTAPTTLKSFRAQGTNWDLAGQGKEARDRKNSLAMAQFINSLAVSINASGLSPRATIIFNQAMAAGKFRWGRKAKLVAGASLAVALREYRRPDSLGDIAYLLEEQSSTLVRTLTAVVSLLDLSLTPVDPSIHIPTLLNHLTSLVTKDPLQPQLQPTSQIPAPLLSQLKLLSLRAASHTATALSTLLVRLGPDHALNSLPSAPTAVALVLLGLEAESRAPLSHIGDLAQCLASCQKTSRGVIMARYKLVQDEIAAWIEQVPWLGRYEQRSSGKGKNRAKVGKRAIVARGIADVLQFQEEIWRGKLKPAVVLDVDGEDDEETVETFISTTTTATRGSSEPLARPAKRAKLAHHPLRDATQFLLDPLTAPLPACESPSEPVARGRSQPPSQAQAHLREASTSPPPFQNNAASSRYPTLPQRIYTPASASTSTLRAPSQALPVSHPSGPPPPPPQAHISSRPFLPSYILSASCISAFRSLAPPTRLQLLIASRGAADDISDEELFGEGELEGMLRPPGEAEEVRLRLDEAERLGKEGAKGKRRGERKKRRRGEGEGEGETRKSRVDLEALARFLEDPEAQGGGSDDKDDEGRYDALFLGLEQFSDKDEDEGGNLLYDDDGEDEDRGHGGHRGSSSVAKGALKTPPRPLQFVPTVQGTDDEMVLDEWRPLSPEQGFGYAHGGQYEEEYD